MHGNLKKLVVPGVAAGADRREYGHWFSGQPDIIQIRSQKTRTNVTRKLWSFEDYA